jgi:hypothetical protein
MRNYISIIITLFYFSSLYAQHEEPNATNSLRVYAETYYGAGLGLFNSGENEMPDFLYSHHRHNEFNLNLGLIQFSHESDQARAVLGLMAGTYANKNLAAEPGVLKNIYQANIGLKLSRSQQLWMDIGIFESHIGFESAIGKAHNFMTRSLLAENSPYYSAGINFNYTSKNEQLKISLLALNGWQKINRDPLNQAPSIGTQINYKPFEGVTLNSSSYIGPEHTDLGLRNRVFHNFYAQLENEESSFIFGIDYGMQRNFSSNWDDWLGAIIEGKRSLHEKFSIAGRFEYFYDAGNTVVAYGNNNLFINFGSTLCLNYAPNDLVDLRLEGKNYFANDTYFEMAEDNSSLFWYVGFSLLFDIDVLKP